MMPPPSPCVSICTLDDNRVCLGCRRTLEEIRRWPRLAAEEQWRIVRELPQRAATDVADV